jgi:hypothetical protein
MSVISVRLSLADRMRLLLGWRLVIYGDAFGEIRLYRKDGEQYRSVTVEAKP